MKNNYKVEIGGKTIEVKLGGLADQASGSCFMQQGDTSILATAQSGEEVPGLNFFPLTCEYEEKFYAAGKILGSRFIRREGRPSISAVLISRIIDRTLRPLFPQELKKEVQVIATCLSLDTENDPAVLGLNAASLALSLSDIPFSGPVVGVRIAKIEDEIILNPTYEQRETCDIDVIFAGIEEKEGILINMIEIKANESQEKELEEIFDFALAPLKQLIDFQKEIIKDNKQEKFQLIEKEKNAKLEKYVQDYINKNLEKALFQEDRRKSKKDTKESSKELIELIKKDFTEEDIETAKNIFQDAKEKLLAESVLKKEKRPDSRKLDEVREITASVSFLPRTHGSAIFSRGETRILSIVTLGSPGEQQLLEEMEFSGKKRFLHHYNFPPYSVGEVKRLGSPGRREIGHGMLAEKAILPLLPSLDDFPYTIRVVSEALSSNGSTSMASVSAACLALMDAGVPIKRLATGVAIGLIKQDEKNYKLLTDIQGPEDSLGDMDFKVAGTEQGITAVQMDVKVNGINKEIFTQALTRAKQARLSILKTMTEAIQEPRKDLSPFAPRIHVLQINPDKIGAVIGTGGKVINEIIEECGVTIDIEDTGQVFIASTDSESSQKAIDWVKRLTKEFKLGEVINGKIVRISDFGAFVELAPGQDGLVHISEFADFRINKVEDVVKLGQEIPVKIINIDDQGRLKLSAKQAGFSPPQKKAILSKRQNGHGRTGK